MSDIVLFFNIVLSSEEFIKRTNIKKKIHFLQIFGISCLFKFFQNRYVYFNSNSSTSKIKVALGGMTPPAPRVP